MPAYFNISVQFKRYDLYPSFVKDFHAVLDENGMVFRSGYWGFEDDSLEGIIRWNQRKLEEDFNLGFTEHHIHDYKQVIYSFGSYSDVLMKGYPVRFKKEKMGEFLELSKEIWQFPPVRAMQTGLEGDEASAGLYISEGTIGRPFASAGRLLPRRWTDKGAPLCSGHIDGTLRFM